MRPHVSSTSAQSHGSGKDVDEYRSGAQSAVQGNDFELTPAVKMESQHSVEGPIGREFP